MLGDLLWSLFVFFFMVIYFMMLFRVILDVFRSTDMGGGMKAVWLIILLIIPVLSMLIYVIARGKGMGERDIAQMESMKAEQDAYIKKVAGSDSPTDQIAQAQQLLQSGAITQDEFNALKQKALAS